MDINLSNNPALGGTITKLSSALKYMDVTNTGLSGPVDVSSISSSNLTNCKFGSSTKLCIQSATSLPGNLCSGFQNLQTCGLKASSTSNTTSAKSENTIKETEAILSSSISSTIDSDEHSEIRLDNSDMSTPIILAWTIAAILMAVSLIFCLCLMFAHKYGKSYKVNARRISKTQSIGGKVTRLNSYCPKNGAIRQRFESLVQNRSIYEAQAEIMADRIIEKNGEKYFPVISEYNKIKPDEMSLTSGDTITLYKVFDDGWAEGVSLRNGSSAYFPLKCLGGSVPFILHDPDFVQSSLMLKTDLETINSPLPPLLQVTPVFLSPTSASRHTILPFFDQKTSNSEISEKSKDLEDLETLNWREDFTPLLSDQNLDFDSSYNPFRGSLLNNKSSTDVSFP